MGGLFDPVHNGHLRTVLTVVENLLLDEVRLIPCGKPAHRQPSIVSDSQRIEMLSLGINGQPELIVDSRECRREGPSYLYDSLLSIKHENPADRLFLIMGTDAFNTVPQWYRWQDIFSLAHVIVCARPGWTISNQGEIREEFDQRQVQSIAEMVKYKAGKILSFDFTPLMISSSQIRKLIKDKQSARYLLPDSVWEYIKINNLYL